MVYPPQKSQDLHLTVAMCLFRWMYGITSALIIIFFYYVVWIFNQSLIEGRIEERKGDYDPHACVSLWIDSDSHLVITRSVIVE